MTDPALFALLTDVRDSLQEMNARLARLEAAQAPPISALASALAATFGNRAFTAREALDAADRQAREDVTSGRTIGGLPKALADARITSPLAFGKRALELGITPIGKDGGRVLWSVSRWVIPPARLSTDPPGSEARSTPTRNPQQGNTP